MYWIWENSQAIEITQEQALRMLGYISISPSAYQAQLYGKLWDKR